MNIAHLNSDQRAAVLSTEGPLLIIAGPGSGKTFTLIERILYLIVEKGVEPENILVSTFTEKAAAELITRVSTRLAEIGRPVNLNEMYIGTLHSICLRFLDEHREMTRLKRNYTLLDQFDQQYMLYQGIYDYREAENSSHILGSPNSGRWTQAKSLATWMNTVSEELLDVNELRESDDERVGALGTLYEMYQEHLRRENVLDFSTIQLEAYHLLRNHSNVLEELQGKLRYLMVDEYQDTNTVQEAILLLLAGSDRNLCVVGDDDQSLYRFRGATVRNILEFPNHFSEHPCKRVKLSTNYRSHPGIIDFFDGWMEKNDWEHGDETFRFDKSILARTGTAFHDGPSVVKVGKDGVRGWCEEVYQFLLHLRNEGKLTDWNQVAFLFKSVKNDKVKELAKYLEDRDISVYSPRSNQLFDREETRLVLGGLIFLFPQFHSLLKEKWPGDKKLEIWTYYEECLGAFLEVVKKPENKGLFDWCRKKAAVHANLGANTDYTFSGLFYELLRFQPFKSFLGDEALGGVVDSRPARNLALFSKLLTKFEYLHHINLFTPDTLNKHLVTFFNYYFRYLKLGGLDEFEDPAEYAPSGCVSFMTVHQAKGLEFPVVLVGSLWSIPTRQHTDLDAVLQESYYHKPPFEPLERVKFYDFWRLYYTAFSRAQNVLALTGHEKSSGHWQCPSKYLRSVYNEIPYWHEHKSTLAQIELEDVGEVNLKEQYSFTSHIALFENCARQYKFFKDLDFAPVRRSAVLFGTLVHQTIEDVHKAALRGEAHRITEEQIERWFETNYKHLTTKERRYLAPVTKKAALDQVKRYVARNGDDWSHLQEAEVDVSLVKDEYILSGTVDLIRGEGDTVEIVDFKSEKKPDLHREAERIDRYRRQLEVYGHIIEERLGKKVSRLHLYYTGEKSGTPYISFDMDPDSVDATITTFDEVVRRIEAKDYRIDERPLHLCENCDMRYYCADHDTNGHDTDGTVAAAA